MGFMASTREKSIATLFLPHHIRENVSVSSFKSYSSTSSSLISWSSSLLQPRYRLMPAVTDRNQVGLDWRNCVREYECMCVSVRVPSVTGGSGHGPRPTPAPACLIIRLMRVFARVASPPPPLFPLSPNHCSHTARDPRSVRVRRSQQSRGIHEL
jgi:hypothetical protein